MTKLVARGYVPLKCNFNCDSARENPLRSYVCDTMLSASTWVFKSPRMQPCMSLLAQTYADIAGRLIASLITFQLIIMTESLTKNGPLLHSIATTSSFFFNSAICFAVMPFRFPALAFAFPFAPFAIRNCTASSLPFSAARCIAVHPFFDVVSVKSCPFDFITSKTLTCPF
jgi:hypothetical protein